MEDLPVPLEILVTCAVGIGILFWVWVLGYIIFLIWDTWKNG